MGSEFWHLCSLVAPCRPSSIRRFYAGFSPRGNDVALMVDAVQSLISGDETEQPDYREGLVATSAEAQLWEIGSGLPASPPLALSCLASFADFSADRRYVIVNGETPGVLDVIKSRRVIQLSDMALLHISFSPDARKIVVSSRDEYARVCEIQSATRNGVWTGFNAPDPVLVGVPRDLWHSESGQIYSLLRHTRSVRCTVFSPDARLIATASKDQSARVWDAATGEPVTPPLRRKGSGGVNRVAFTPDAHWLLTATGDGRVDVWDLSSEDRPVEDQLQLAELLAGRTLEGSAAFVASTAPRVRAAWDKLRRKYPSDFVASPQQVLTWQQRQAQDRTNLATGPR